MYTSRNLRDGQIFGFTESPKHWVVPWFFQDRQEKKGDSEIVQRPLPG
jgi:hypothetical protein